jgi:hypothetical protein
MFCEQLWNVVLDTGLLESRAEDEFVQKEWRVFMGLNGEWARRALALDFNHVNGEFEARGYEVCVFAWVSKLEDFF